MCVTLLWAVNGSAWSDDLARYTERRLGVAPQSSELTIASELLRESAVTFTLERRMCDCDALVGLQDRPLEDGETTPDQWLGWLEHLPARAPTVQHVAVLRVWSPERRRLRPVREQVVPVSEVDEARLREVQDGDLLVIDYRALTSVP